MLSAAQITYHVDACARNSRKSQETIYGSFYGYAMAICERYTNNHQDAMEILNDSFLKVFKKIHSYKPAYTDITSSFKGWIRKIVICTAIDYYRKKAIAARLSLTWMKSFTGCLFCMRGRFKKWIVTKYSLPLFQNLSPAYRRSL